MGLGPMDAQESGQIWSELDKTQVSLEDLFENHRRAHFSFQTFPRRIRGIVIPLDTLSAGGPIMTVIEHSKVVHIRAMRYPCFPRH